MRGKPRWEIAQEAERQFWRSDSSISRVKTIRWSQTIKRKAYQIISWMREAYDKDIRDCNVLQIGAGCDGFINFIDGNRYAIDPLANFYLKNYRELIPSDIEYRSGVGEELPWKKNFFDIILIYNCLDHTYNPRAVLNESFRTLKNHGILYIGVHVFSLLGYFITKPRSNALWMLDHAHPHAFTTPILFDKLSNSDFKVISYKINPKYIRKRRKLPYPLSNVYSQIVKERFLHLLASKVS